MKLRFWLSILFGAMLLSATGASCASAANDAISLASFTESYVEVSISLERNAEGSYLLAGTFTPPDKYHLYSKDIPITGVDGLGRPTLLELTADSLMKVTGTLTADVKAQAPDFEPRALLVYPLGAVTLSLPVELPPGDDWMDDQVKVTYMACSDSQCKLPVVGKIVPVRIPGADMFDHR